MDDILADLDQALTAAL
ncbi:MAG: hypothetical protein AB7L36_13815 [Sphingomonadaceae bacterium]